MDETYKNMDENNNDDWDLSSDDEDGDGINDEGSEGVSEKSTTSEEGATYDPWYDEEVEQTLSQQNLTSDDDDADFPQPVVPGMVLVQSSKHEEENNLEGDLIQVITTLQQLQPDFEVDPQEVERLLMQNEVPTTNRRNFVIDMLIAKRLNDTLNAELNERSRAGRELAGPAMALQMTDPRAVAAAEKFKELLADVDVVKNFIPEKSNEEILAYLEAFHENPNRVRVVTAELLQVTAMGNANRRKIMERVEAEIPAVVESDNEIKTEEDKKRADERLTQIMELLPDADPEAVSDFIAKHLYNADLINSTVSDWLEKKNFPRLDDKKREAKKRKWIESDLSVEEFLQMFPDPENYFKDRDRETSENYKQHVVQHLVNTYRHAYKVDLLRITQKYKYHLTPTIHELNQRYNHSNNDEPLLKRRKDMLRKKKVPTSIKPMPRVLDELFYKEKFFLEMEDKIKKYLEDKKREKAEKLKKGRKDGTLMTCNCCYEDEVLMEDMRNCISDHLFCRDCISRHAEVLIGDGKYTFPCLDAYCKSTFPISVLQNCLKPNIFSNAIRKIQEEEIRQAEIPDLVSCPFCTFCTIMPDPNDTLLKCLNPDCLKVSCRQCKEVNHLPLRCHEIEKRGEVHMRTFIEDKMTEALLRTCPKCGRRFIKEYGCNWMTCPCGQFMCYLCRQPINNYDHFETGPCPCPLYSHDEELHDLQVQVGAKKARQTYVTEHPEAANLVLKHDPIKEVVPLRIPQRVPVIDTQDLNEMNFFERLYRRFLPP